MPLEHRTLPVQTCGYCKGRGRVPGPRRDRYGPRDDYPAEVTCEYCDGSGETECGEMLFPHRGLATEGGGE